MADLTSILGGAWSPPVAPSFGTPEQQLIDAISAAGLTPPATVFLDGKVHRFRSDSKGRPVGNDKPGWYVAFSDGVPAGRFGCWRMGIESVWRANIGRDLSPSEEHALSLRMHEAMAAREAALGKQYEVTSETVATIWESAAPAAASHEYLARKGIQPHGARITGDGRLIVPLYGDDGVLSSLQYIQALPEGSKKQYHPGGKVGGKFWMLGSLENPGPLYVCEGYATGATIYEASQGRPVAIAYSAANLVATTGILREKYGAQQEIVVVADNDASDIGRNYAEQACAKFGARMVIPPEKGDANDYALAGHDLSALLHPHREEWLTPADDLAKQPAPIAWIVKHWVQSNALVMVHGASGSGKTFIVLDWCLRAASGMNDWCGHKVKPGNVVYLAGEGHHGIRGRIAAWKHHHQAGPLSMWISKSGCDLNTSSGYQAVVDHVSQLPTKPDLIVVDTLHRFLSGDENSAKDAKTMLDACNSLMSVFQCTVLLVHHTGVGDEAQHRARGSSAWRGALDVEISVVPSPDAGPIQIIQRKSKDAEMAAPIMVDLESVAIPGWLDEDGEPVTSAVVIPSAALPRPHKESRIEVNRKQFENAWWASGAEERQGVPYLSRSALKEKLLADGRKPRTVENDLSPAYDDKLIGSLMLGEIIAAYEHGWIVTNEIHASAMMLRKNMS